MFRKSKPSSAVDAASPLSAGLLVLCLSSLAVSVEAVKKSSTVTLFTELSSGSVYQIVSAAKFNSGCPSMPQVVAEIVQACNVTQGAQNLPVEWTQISSYLGNHLRFMQGAGQAADAEAVKCIAGFLDAFARALAVDKELPVGLIVGLSVAACVILLCIAACGGVGAVAAYRCYQAKQDERTGYSPI